MISDPPEDDRFAEQIEDHLARVEKPRPRMVLDESPASAGPGFFHAAATLFRRQPWAFFPSDQDVVLFSVPALGVHEAVLSVMGHDGDNQGILLFHTLGDFETYVAVAVNENGVFSSTGEDIEKDKLPPHLALTFDGARHIDPGLRALVKARRWDLAGEQAYPSVMAVDAGMRVRVALGWEQLLLEAAALGLCRFLEAESAVRRAYRTDTFYDDEFSIETSQGELTVILGGPVGGGEEEDIVYGQAIVDGAGEAEDGQESTDPIGEVLRFFAASEDAEPFFDLGACGAFLFHAAQLRELAPAAVAPADVEAVLLETYVHEVPLPPHLAEEIVTILSTFFTWLANEVGEDAPHAAANAALLDDAFMRRLWIGLATPAQWSPKKRAQMTGVPLRPLPPKAKPVGPLSQAEKNKRKAARKKR